MAAELKPRHFKYTAIDAAGSRVENKMIATSEDDVHDALRRAKMIPLDVQDTKKFSASGDVMAMLRGTNAAKMNTSELAQFTRQLNQLLRAGIPITTAMHTLADDPPDEMTGEVLATIADKLTAGSPLKDAFTGYPRMFNEVFIAYMAAGEASGDLVAVSERLANVLDKRAEITRKVKAVSMYPMMVGSVIVMMVAAIILFIVPSYAEIYASLDAPLPAPTRFVVMLSKWLPLIGLVIVAAVVALVYWNKSKKEDLEIGETMDRIKFKIPIFGKLFKKLVLFRFASTMGGGLDSGMQAYDAIDLAAKASDSRWLRATAPDLKRAIAEGRTLTTGMAAHEELYSKTMRKMVATGEETGDLGAMFENVADALGDDIDLVITTMSAKIEVALLVGMGAAVGAILAALYLPIIQLSLTAGEKFGL